MQQMVFRVEGLRNLGGSSGNVQCTLQAYRTEPEEIVMSHDVTIIRTSLGDWECLEYENTTG